MSIDTLPTNATQELGSAISPWHQWLAIDPVTGDWTDWQAEFTARDLEDMLARDGRCRAVEKALVLPQTGAPITVTPGDGDTGETDLVNEALERMSTPLELVRDQGAYSQIYRATFCEKIFTVTGDRVGYDSIAWRPRDTCRMRRDAKTGQLTGFTQDLYGQAKPVTIPLAKSVIFVHGADRDPVRGVSEMQVAYRCYADKQKLRLLWFLALERAGAPWVIAPVTSGLETKTANALTKLRAGGVVATADLTGPAQVLNVAEGVDNLFVSAVKFLDSEIAGSVLANFLDLGSMASRGAGSYALSKDQTDFFTNAQDGTARELGRTIREQIIRPLVVLNKGVTGVVPNVQVGPISGADAGQSVALLQALASSPTGTGLPGEFVDELTMQVAGKLDLDVDKIQAAVQRAREQPVPPGAAASQPVHAAVTALSADPGVQAAVRELQARGVGG